MKLNKILMSALMLGAAFTASAQEQPQTKTENVFKPHWYIQGQVGGQYTLGEVAFGELLSPNAQIGVGYNFNPVVGARLAVNAWQSKAGWDGNGDPTWKWNYVAPTVDVMVNLSNWWCGYNPDRIFNFGIFGGIGANIAFNNDEAVDQEQTLSASFEDYQSLRYLWKDTKTLFMVQAGMTADFRLNDNLSLGLEVSANSLGDTYNSKSAGNPDWYFNALVGVKYCFGKTRTTKEVAIPQPQERVIERVIERVVEKPATNANAEVKVEPLRRDVFFCLSCTEITVAEMQKVKEIADYLNKYPNAKVEITGYADKGTGNASINKRLSEKRAQVVVDALINNYDISASRITSDSKGDTVQPFAEEVLNRVSICIAK